MRPPGGSGAASSANSWKRPGSPSGLARNAGLAEEAPFAYKDVDEVVATCEQARLDDAWRGYAPSAS